MKRINLKKNIRVNENLFVKKLMKNKKKRKILKASLNYR